MKRVVRALVFGFAAVLLLVWPAAWLVGLVGGKVVVPVEELFEADVVEKTLPHFDPAFSMDPSASPDVQKQQRDLELASVYGLDPREPTTLVVPDGARCREVAYPDRDERLVLYVWPGSHHPLQLRTVYFAARLATFWVGGALVVLLGIAFVFFRGRSDDD